MDSLTAARAQMEISLGFHMIFAAAGMALPLMMLLAEAGWLRTRDPALLHLACTWGKATAVLFAIGAVSGTALAFELGLLWPRRHRGESALSKSFSQIPAAVGVPAIPGSKNPA